MRFLANENLPMPSILMLREKGIDVTSILESYPSITDAEVVAIAQNENLIILTYDKDYGEIIFKQQTNNPPSVIYFKEKWQTPHSAAERLLTLIREGTVDFYNAFTTIDTLIVRQTVYKK